MTTTTGRDKSSSFGVTSSAGAALSGGLSGGMGGMGGMGGTVMIDPMGMPRVRNIAFPNLKSEGLTETHHGLGSNKSNKGNKSSHHKSSRGSRNNGRFSVGTSFMPQGAKNAAKTALRFGSRFGTNFGIGGFGQKSSLVDSAGSKFGGGAHGGGGGSGSSNFERRNHSSSGRGSSSHGNGNYGGRNSYYKGTGYSSQDKNSNPSTFSTRGQFSYSKASRQQQYTSAYSQHSKGPPSSHGLRKGPPSSHGIRSSGGPPSSHGRGQRNGPPSSHGLRGLRGPPSSHGLTGPPSSHGLRGPPSSHGGQLRLRTPNFDFTSPGYRPSQSNVGRRNNIGWAYR